ncbi:uncharacterized protein LOC135691380 [Rhopilema esculentum]|uniref:uncharacterized protein LOC135691380 n=1 Tax=Rhopilema esculentum TaxID=499914 RepID=UPI0031D07C3D
MRGRFFHSNSFVFLIAFLAIFQATSITDAAKNRHHVKKTKISAKPSKRTLISGFNREDLVDAHEEYFVDTPSLNNQIPNAETGRIHSETAGQQPLYVPMPDADVEASPLGDAQVPTVSSNEYKIAYSDGLPFPTSPSRNQDNLLVYDTPQDPLEESNSNTVKIADPLASKKLFSNDGFSHGMGEVSNALNNLLIDKVLNSDNDKDFNKELKLLSEEFAQGEVEEKEERKKPSCQPGAKSIFANCKKKRSAVCSPEDRGTFFKNALKVHNLFRKIHGVPDLELNDKLSKDAQEYAEHLAKTASSDHSLRRDRPGQGENIAVGCTSAGSELRAKEAISQWYSKACEKGFDFSGYKKGVEPFAQLVWKATSFLGMGKAVSNRDGNLCTYIVARYSPEGDKNTFSENVIKGTFSKDGICSSSCVVKGNVPQKQKEPEVLQEASSEKPKVQHSSATAAQAVDKPGVEEHRQVPKKHPVQPELKKVEESKPDQTTTKPSAGSTRIQGENAINNKQETGNSGEVGNKKVPENVAKPAKPTPSGIGLSKVNDENIKPTPKLEPNKQELQKPEHQNLVAPKPQMIAPNQDKEKVNDDKNGIKVTANEPTPKVPMLINITFPKALQAKNDSMIQITVGSDKESNPEQANFHPVVNFTGKSGQILTAGDEFFEEEGRRGKMSEGNVADVSAKFLEKSDANTGYKMSDFLNQEFGDQASTIDKTEGKIVQNGTRKTTEVQNKKALSHMFQDRKGMNFKNEDNSVTYLRIANKLMHNGKTSSSDVYFSPKKLENDEAVGYAKESSKGDYGFTDQAAINESGASGTTVANKTTGSSLRKVDGNITIPHALTYSNENYKNLTVNSSVIVPVHKTSGLVEHSPPSDVVDTKSNEMETERRANQNETAKNTANLGEESYKEKPTKEGEKGLSNEGTGYKQSNPGSSDIDKINEFNPKLNNDPQQVKYNYSSEKVEETGATKISTKNNEGHHQVESAGDKTSSPMSNHRFMKIFDFAEVSDHSIEKKKQHHGRVENNKFMDLEKQILSQQDNIFHRKAGESAKGYTGHRTGGNSEGQGERPSNSESKLQLSREKESFPEVGKGLDSTLISTKNQNDIGNKNLTMSKEVKAAKYPDEVERKVGEAKNSVLENQTSKQLPKLSTAEIQVSDVSNKMNKDVHESKNQLETGNLKSEESPENKVENPILSNKVLQKEDSNAEHGSSSESFKINGDHAESTQKVTGSVNEPNTHQISEPLSQHEIQKDTENTTTIDVGTGFIKIQYQKPHERISASRGNNEQSYVNESSSGFESLKLSSDGDKQNPNSNSITEFSHNIGNNAFAEKHSKHSVDNQEAKILSSSVQETLKKNPLQKEESSKSFSPEINMQNPHHYIIQIKPTHSFHNSADSQPDKDITPVEGSSLKHRVAEFVSANGKDSFGNEEDMSTAKQVSRYQESSVEDQDLSQEDLMKDNIDANAQHVKLGNKDVRNRPVENESKETAGSFNNEGNSGRYSHRVDGHDSKYHKEEDGAVEYGSKLKAEPSDVKHQKGTSFHENQKISKSSDNDRKLYSDDKINEKASKDFSKQVKTDEFSTIREGFLKLKNTDLKSDAKIDFEETGNSKKKVYDRKFSSSKTDVSNDIGNVEKEKTWKMSDNQIQAGHVHNEDHHEIQTNRKSNRLFAKYEASDIINNDEFSNVNEFETESPQQIDTEKQNMKEDKHGRLDTESNHAVAEMNTRKQEDLSTVRFSSDEKHESHKHNENRMKSFKENQKQKFDNDLHYSSPNQVNSEENMNNTPKQYSKERHESTESSEGIKLNKGRTKTADFIKDKTAKDSSAIVGLNLESGYGNIKGFSHGLEQKGSRLEGKELADSSKLIGTEANDQEEIQRKTIFIPREVILKFQKDMAIEHNRYRNIHSASPLLLNSRMSKESQWYADNLARKGSVNHSPLKSRPGIGESIEKLCTKSNGIPTASQVVKKWYEEVCNPGYNFKRDGKQVGTGHFTQIVWKDTKALGIGLAASKSEDGHICSYVVARYYQAGNDLGTIRSNVGKGHFRSCNDNTNSHMTPTSHVTSARPSHTGTQRRHHKTTHWHRRPSTHTSRPTLKHYSRTKPTHRGFKQSNSPSVHRINAFNQNSEREFATPSSFYKGYMNLEVRPTLSQKLRFYAKGTQMKPNVRVDVGGFGAKGYGMFESKLTKEHREQEVKEEKDNFGASKTTFAGFNNVKPLREHSNSDKFHFKIEKQSADSNNWVKPGLEKMQPKDTLAKKLGHSKVLLESPKYEDFRLDHKNNGEDEFEVKRKPGSSEVEFIDVLSGRESAHQKASGKQQIQHKNQQNVFNHVSSEITSDGRKTNRMHSNFAHNTSQKVYRPLEEFKTPLNDNRGKNGWVHSHVVKQKAASDFANEDHKASGKNSDLILSTPRKMNSPIDKFQMLLNENRGKSNKEHSHEVKPLSTNEFMIPTKSSYHKPANRMSLHKGGVLKGFNAKESHNSLLKAGNSELKSHSKETFNTRPISSGFKAHAEENAFRASHNHNQHTTKYNNNLQINAPTIMKFDAKQRKPLNKNKVKIAEFKKPDPSHGDAKPSQKLAMQNVVHQPPAAKANSGTAPNVMKSDFGYMAGLRAGLGLGDKQDKSFYEEPTGKIPLDSTDTTSRILQSISGPGPALPFENIENGINLSSLQQEGANIEEEISNEAKQIDYQDIVGQGRAGNLDLVTSENDNKAPGMIMDEYRYNTAENGEVGSIYDSREEEIGEKMGTIADRKRYSGARTSEESGQKQKEPVTANKLMEQQKGVQYGRYPSAASKMDQNNRNDLKPQSWNFAGDSLRFVKPSKNKGTKNIQSAMPFLGSRNKPSTFMAGHAPDKTKKTPYFRPSTIGGRTTQLPAGFNSGFQAALYSFGNKDFDKIEEVAATKKGFLSRAPSQASKKAISILTDNPLAHGGLVKSIINKYGNYSAIESDNYDTSRTRHFVIDKNNNLVLAPGENTGHVTDFEAKIWQCWHIKRLMV